jgi:hypothetical protein
MTNWLNFDTKLVYVYKHNHTNIAKDIHLSFPVSLHAKNYHQEMLTMERQTSFFIGFFSAIVIVLPILVGAVYLFSTKGASAITFIFGILAGLLITLFLILIFRKTITKRIFGTASSNLESVSNSFGSLILASIKGNERQIQKHSHEATRNFISWYSWINFYRWVITSCISIAGAFAVLIGAVLLIEQNQHLKANNEILRKTTAVQNLNHLLEKPHRVASLGHSLATVGPLMDTGHASTSATEKDFERVLSFFEIVSIQALSDYRSYEIVHATFGLPMIRFYQRPEIRDYVAKTREAIEDLDSGAWQHYEYFALCIGENLSRSSHQDSISNKPRKTRCREIELASPFLPLDKPVNNIERVLSRLKHFF